MMQNNESSTMIIDRPGASLKFDKDDTIIRPGVSLPIGIEDRSSVFRKSSSDPKESNIPTIQRAFPISETEEAPRINKARLARSSKAIWKDKGGKIKCGTSFVPTRATSAKQATVRQKCCAASAGIAAGGIVGLVAMGPVGLVVGAVTTGKAAAGIAIVKRQYDKVRKAKAQQKVRDLEATTRAPPCQNPPSRSFPIQEEKVPSIKRAPPCQNIPFRSFPIHEDYDC